MPHIARRATLVIALAALLSGCALPPPKAALQPEARQSVKRIALVELQEQPEYYFQPAQAAGGSLLYAFGAIGGAILGTIEASRASAATARFTSALSPLKPGLAPQLMTQLETGLRNKGYEVIRVPALPLSSDGKTPDYSKVTVPVDAILVTTMRAGYFEQGGARPMVSITATLAPRAGGTNLFSDNYLYSSRKIGEWVQIEPESRFSVNSADDLYTDPSLPLEALRAGTGRIAERIVADL